MNVFSLSGGKDMYSFCFNKAFQQSFFNYFLIIP